MKFRTLLGLATSLACLAGLAAAATQSPTVGPPSALATEAPDALKHRLLGELEATLTEDATSIRTRRSFPGWSGVNYWTRPRLSGVHGLCSANFLELYFATPDDPSTISSVYVLSYFHFLHSPTRLLPPPADEGDTAAKATCAGLHPGAADAFLEAFDEDIAWTGAWIFNAAQAQARGGDSLPIDCDSHDAAACRKQFAGLQPSQLGSVNTCDHSAAEHSNCWEFEVNKPGQTTPQGDCSSGNVMCVIVPAGYDTVRIIVDDHSMPTKVTENAVGFTE
jgi:hypothetical protein